MTGGGIKSQEGSCVRELMKRNCFFGSGWTKTGKDMNSCSGYTKVSKIEHLIKGSECGERSSNLTEVRDKTLMEIDKYQKALQLVSES